MSDEMLVVEQSVGQADRRDPTGSVPAAPVSGVVGIVGGASRPPGAVLRRADATTRSRVALSLQRSVGNAAAALVLGRTIQRKFVKESEQTPEQKAFVRAELAKQTAEAGRIAARFKSMAAAELSKAREYFKAAPMMKSGPVPRVGTPLTAQDVARAYGAAWAKVFGKPIPANALSILIGRWKTEGGEKGISNYNIGNIQYPGRDQTAKQTDKNLPAESSPSDFSWWGAPELDAKKGARSVKKAWYASYKSAEAGALGVIQFITQDRVLSA